MRPFAKDTFLSEKKILMRKKDGFLDGIPEIFQFFPLEICEKREVFLALGAVKHNRLQLSRQEAILFLKAFAEIGRAGKPYGISYFGYRSGPALDQLLGSF